MTVLTDVATGYRYLRVSGYDATPLEDAMTVRDVIERLAECGYDGVEALILGEDGYYYAVDFVNPHETVASRDYAVLVAKRK